jgi:aryl-alcohol dehydrogenase-like predicted oxidoreductase
VAQAWLLGRPEVTSIIIGARNETQLSENLACLTVALDDADLQALGSISEPEWGYPYDFIKAREPW